MTENPDNPAYEWLSSLYGAPVPSAENVAMRLVHELVWDQSVLQQWDLATNDGLQWRVYLLESGIKFKRTDFAQRILLSGDGCWPHCVSPEAMRECLAQGVALAWFDRLELADDPPSKQRQGAFYTRYPERSCGCLMVWAWGLATTAQALKTLLPKAKVAVIGHSRGGKAALLAAATDDRIDGVVANNSGTGGAASSSVSTEGAENLQVLMTHYPHWFGAATQLPAAQAHLAQLDVTALWEKIIPRPLLILQAKDDSWANPAGTRHTYGSLRKRWPDAPEDSLRLIERDGAHAMQITDWANAARWWRIAPIPTIR